MNQLVFLLLAAALVFVGVWARRDAPALISSYLDERARTKRQRVIRRGGMVCLMLAGVFAAFAVADLLAS